MNDAGDSKSKNLIKKSLEKKGFIVSDCDNNMQKGVKRPDLIGTKNNLTYAFEIKQRYFESDKYQDIMITDDKLWMLDKYDKIYFVFLYNNGVGFILDGRTKPDEIRKTYAKKTTRFYDNRLVCKNYLIWNQNRGYKFKFDINTIY